MKIEVTGTRQRSKRCFKTYARVSLESGDVVKTPRTKITKSLIGKLESAQPDASHGKMEVHHPPFPGLLSLDTTCIGSLCEP